MKPQTKADLYFDKLKTNQIFNIQIQSNDDNVERENMTDEIWTNDVFNQFPEDVGFNYWKLRKDGASVNEQQGDLESKINLNEFISWATPVIESLLNENLEIWNLEAPKAKNKNS